MSEGSKTEAIPKRVLYRMAIYYRHLMHLEETGIDRVSSKELSAKAGVTASQLRQDLHYFGSFGQQGFGYRVDELLGRIKKIIGLDHTQNMILVGAGRLGQALASYTNFAKRGFQLIGVFDTDPDLVGEKVGGITVYHSNELETFLQSHSVDVGILAVPAAVAQTAAEVLVNCGIEAIWNFAPIRLSVPPNVTVEHIHLTDSLVALAFTAKLNREIRNKLDV